MEEIIHKFGIDGKLVVIQIINFTVLVGLLSYLLYKPLLKVLAEREEKIAQGVADAEAAAGARASAEDEKKAIVSSAHQEASEVGARAKVSAEEKAAEIIESAEEKANAVLRQAEARGEDIKAQAHKDSEAEITKLAVLAAEKVLKERAS